MKAKFVFALIPGMVALVAAIAVFHSRNQPSSPESQQPDATLSTETADSSPEATVSRMAPAPRPIASPARESAAPRPPVEEPIVETNKVERLAQIRETFHALATGDPTTALRGARQIGDETQRETALLALITEWTHGELRSPRERARDITMYGLEAGLGMELAKNPDLAVLWANELTDGPARAAVLQQTAIALAASDPASAFALSQQLPEGERRKFSDSVIAGWASKDTEAALQWANQSPDAAQRDAALQAIRSVAPVGIGAALSMQDGYAVVNQLVPGAPAELSGQLHSGDRIVALAQGNEPFVDARSLPLQNLVQMIRGAPGSQLQLQILPADAPPDSQPRSVSILRDQIKYKRPSP